MAADGLRFNEAYCPNAMCSPRRASVLSGHAINLTDQLMANIGETNVNAVLAVMHGRAPRSVVNAEVLDSPLWRAKAAALRACFGKD